MTCSICSYSEHIGIPVHCLHGEHPCKVTNQLKQKCPDFFKRGTKLKYGATSPKLTIKEVQRRLYGIKG